MNKHDEIDHWDEAEKADSIEQMRAYEFHALVLQTIGEDAMQERTEGLRGHVYLGKGDDQDHDCRVCSTDGTLMPVGDEGWQICLVCSYQESPDAVYCRAQQELLDRAMEKS